MDFRTKSGKDNKKNKHFGVVESHNGTLLEETEHLGEDKTYIFKEKL